jgi:hypothetical protein
MLCVIPSVFFCDSSLRRSLSHLKVSVSTEEYKKKKKSVEIEQDRRQIWATAIRSSRFLTFAIDAYRHFFFHKKIFCHLPAHHGPARMDGECTVLCGAHECG